MRSQIIHRLCFYMGVGANNGFAGPDRVIGYDPAPTPSAVCMCDSSVFGSAPVSPVYCSSFLPIWMYLPRAMVCTDSRASGEGQDKRLREVTQSVNSIIPSTEVRVELKIMRMTG